MRKKNPTSKQKQIAQAVYNALESLYPDARCGLDYQNAWQLLIATVLSAQCTDKKVNSVTPLLFGKYPDSQSMAQAPLEDLESSIRSIGLFRAKAKHIKGCAEIISTRFQGQVPDTMEELILLPGVGRKTANVVLGNWFQKPEGVVVDTHVKRLSVRLGLTKETSPEKIEPELASLYPKERWTMLSHLLICHGRAICAARNPKCQNCNLLALCSYGQTKATES
jgi:endonuclease-3